MLCWGLHDGANHVPSCAPTKRVKRGLEERVRFRGLLRRRMMMMMMMNSYGVERGGVHMMDVVA